MNFAWDDASERQTMEQCWAMGLRPGVQDRALAESALVERSRRNLDAFAEIVDAYQARVLGFVKRMVVDSEDAADIAQETFIRAYQGLKRFDNRSSLRTWLFRIAYNLCVDRARRTVRAPAEIRLDAVLAEEEPMQLPDSRWDPEGLAMDQELQSIVEEEIANMSDKLRSVLLLHDREDMAYEEIAGTLSIPVGTVKSRLFLARAYLQRVLEPYLRSEVKFDDR